MFYMYLYVNIDEIHFSSFESGQGNDLTSEPWLDPDFGQKNLTFDKNISSHYCFLLHEVKLQLLQ